MTQEEAFQADIQANPGDGSLRLIYADWLQEQGQADLAFGYRWSGRRGYYPHVSPKGRVIGWHAVPPPGSRKSSWLPREIWAHLPLRRDPRHFSRPARCPKLSSSYLKYYPSVPAAFAALAVSLRWFRDLLAC